jgi:uncharacterized protein (DUF58 family)
MLVGDVNSTLKNKGIEFEDYRKYTQADDAERIDWKVSLKANQLLIRNTVEEKAQKVMFLIDVSDTMLFSSGDKLKCEYAAEIVANLSFAIQLGGNSSGVCFFNDKLVKTLTPSGGARQYFNIITELKKTDNYGGLCDLGNAIKRLMSIIKSSTLIIIISDFINPGDKWDKYLEVAALNHKVLGICVRDTLDRRLPDNLGYFVIEDPSSQKKIVIDTKESFKKYNEKIAEDELFIDKTFKRVSSSCIMIETTENYENKIMGFLENRSKFEK